MTLAGAAAAVAAAGSGSAPRIDFGTAQNLAVIAVCAFTALLAHRVLAVFNDGVRPFLLDLVQGRSTRAATAAIAFGLSAGFVFGLGAPMALASGVLNPWLLFLPTDVLGLLARRWWQALLLGGAWGAVAVFALRGAAGAAGRLPVDFLTALQEMAVPILYVFTLFPMLAVAKQFGRLRGGITGGVELVLVVVSLKLWPGVFPGSVAMAAGVLMLVGFALRRDLRGRGERRDSGGDAGAAEDADDPVAALFSQSAARLRRHLPMFALLGAGIAVLAQLRVLGGGEATSFLIAGGEVGEAAQVDFYRAFGFLPLIATTALASGAYGTVGFTFVYAVGYLMPHPLLAALAGVALFTVEVLALSSLGRVLGRLPSLRDSSEQVRGAIGSCLQIAILFGSLLAAQAMGGGLGIMIVGGLYLANEAMGSPVVRMAAAPAAVIVGGLLLNVLAWAELFTPLRGGG